MDLVAKTHGDKAGGLDAALPFATAPWWEQEMRGWMMEPTVY